MFQAASGVENGTYLTIVIVKVNELPTKLLLIEVMAAQNIVLKIAGKITH